jgi:hypothetical protein
MAWPGAPLSVYIVRWYAGVRGGAVVVPLLLRFFVLNESVEYGFCLQVESNHHVLAFDNCDN